jgi:hypothetical protein
VLDVISKRFCILRFGRIGREQKEAERREKERQDRMEIDRS